MQIGQAPPSPLPHPGNAACLLATCVSRFGRPDARAAKGNERVSLSWNASSGASSYNVKHSTTSGGPYTTVATGVSTTSFTNPVSTWDDQSGNARNATQTTSTNRPSLVTDALEGKPGQPPKSPGAGGSGSNQSAALSNDIASGGDGRAAFASRDRCLHASVYIH
jgi:hypothetical protein